MSDLCHGVAPVAAARALLARAAEVTGDADRIEVIRQLEELKSAAAAVQAAVTAAFVASQRAAQRADGVPAARVGRGIAAQVGLARRVSPFQAQRYTGWAGILTTELPGTFAALQAGRISEWRAMIVARETGCLSREQRATVDRELAPKLETLGDRKVEAEARACAYRLDPAGFVARARAAESERRVTLRPAPDTMARLTGLFPVGQGVAAYAALRKAADTLIGAGDARSHGQIMADTLVERVTGQAKAADVPVEIHLVMSDETLLGDNGSTSATTSVNRQAPGYLCGYGPVPAGLARDLVHRPSDATPMWLRRLFRNPKTGQLAAAESRRRLFTSAQRKFIQLRDQTCRTPWCDAPIRHIDHVQDWADGGPTAVGNGQGYCAACNYAKQAVGWRMHALDGPGRHQIGTTTPTGHQYWSHAPDPPGTRQPRTDLEAQVAANLAAIIRAA